MATNKNFTEKTNNDSKEVGFHYQYYYFIYRLLNLKSGQSVGLEVKDDVHTDLDNDTQLLFQLKHTVKKTNSGDTTALTELDEDLWKTLHNWAKIISDSAAKRQKKSEQIKFVKRSEFHLVTNKTESKKNTFLLELDNFKSSKKSFDELRNHIETLCKKTKNSDIENYIKIVLGLENEVLSLFLSRVHLELALDDLHALIKQSIREKMIEKTRVNLVFERLDSNIRSDNYINIKNGEKIVLDFDSFYSRYRSIFSSSREPLQLNKPFKPAYPEDVFAQTFVKQLIAINAVKKEDLERAFELTTQRLKIARFIEDWHQSGELVTDEIEAFHGDVKGKWRNAFEHWCEDCLDHETVEKAKSLLYELRKIEFSIANSALNTELSNGELYHLSDENLIGWHRDWKII
ncbi:hypothetical protein NJC40_05100 [Pseudomonas sp. 21LCFQ02]|uniref:ABC-three component system protein n=1 Tax=Pseudomonas sp. 21LCFQ02 TaxID=2957505 RepID=UPI00209B211F|nr:ABC-three component system protein [Pseudomonas sp. 21LCFQ02]MCO8167155.1 hypothetical protein [Pseudomonas sp. 21LCFQ02]